MVLLLNHHQLIVLLLTTARRLLKTLPSPAFAILAAILALGATEGLAWWWMHPAPVGSGQPVLCYRPRGRTLDGQLSVDSGACAPRIASHLQSPTAVCTSSSSTDNQPTTTDNSSTYTRLPEIVAKSIPILHCATGAAARIDRENGVTIHLAFFEWESTDSANVLEAFKHLPECCMGSIGMTLMERRPIRAYQIGRETLTFEHAVFRDSNGVIVHTFKGVWVSGLSDLLQSDYHSAIGARVMRYRAGLHRFRPAHARVAQGAVRGIPNPDLAWEAFQDAMLADLKFE